jgi:uncharacterized protein
MASQLSDDELRDILSSCQRIAVIGLSPVPARPSYGVSRYMIRKGYELYGVRPGSPPEILGRPCVDKLADLDAEIDLIDVFRNSDAIPGLVDEIEVWMKSNPGSKKPRVLWLQEGVAHPEAEKKAEGLGLKVVSNRCILKEHMRLL